VRISLHAKSRHISYVLLDAGLRSTSIATKDAPDFSVTGDLTIKNLTKPVTFPVHVVGIIPDRGGRRVGYSGQLTIDRRDWGLVDARLTPAGVLLVGYSVDIGLTVEALTNDPHLDMLCWR
jgi:polyisoprenoid-binding protein YceI